MPYERDFKFELRRVVRNLDTQQVREDAIEDLRSLAKAAYRKAKPTRGKSLDQAVRWARIAAYLYQVINSITRQYDERQINKDLDELERLIDEAHKRAQQNQKEPEEENNAESRGP